MVQNSVFFGNKFYDGSSADFAGWDDFETAGVHVSNTAYGTRIGLYAQSTDWQIEAVYRFGYDGFPESPRFMGHDDQENPFALKRKSPLIGRGAYEGWMASATDVRGSGFPRSKDGSIDLGCYQCNITAPGFVATIR